MSFGLYWAVNVVILDKLALVALAGIMGVLWGYLQSIIWSGKGWGKGRIFIGTLDWEKPY